MTWQEQFDKEFYNFNKSVHPQITNQIKDFITTLRNNDRDELIKMLPEVDNLYLKNGSIVSSYKKEVKQLIQEYYK